MRKCFTNPNLKIKNGNNRQIDLLAFSISNNISFQFESSVTHMPNWNPKIDEIEEKIKYKFFGYPRENNNEVKILILEETKIIKNI